MKYSQLNLDMFFQDMKAKLFKILPKAIRTSPEADKIAHAIYGTLFYLTVAPFSTWLIAMILVMILAIAVEIYDWFDYGRFDWFDALDTIGIPAVITISVEIFKMPR